MGDSTTGGQDEAGPALDPAEVLASLPPGFTELYRVGRTLGRGGQGFAVQAKQLKLKREVVIKFLLVDDPSARQRFLREAELLSKIRHLNVVRLYDFGAVPRAPYLVLEYLSGWPLSTEIRNESLDLDQVVGIAADLFAGLEAVHGIGVVHRDIKPDNIMLSDSGPAKLLDFGIARQDEASSLTRAGVFMGTPAYASPEQLSGEVVDGRTDLYSAGVVFHMMLTGVNPFDGRSLSEIVQKHFSLEVTRVTGSRYRLPPGLENLVVSLLAKSPENRPASASEALAMLERAAPAAAKRVTRNVPAGPSGEHPVTSGTAVTPAAGTAPTGRAIALPPTPSGVRRRVVPVAPPPTRAPPPAWVLAAVTVVTLGATGVGFLALGSRPRDPVATPGPPSAAPSPDARRTQRDDLARFESLRKTWLKEYRRAQQAGLHADKLQADDFRVPSVSPLLEALGMAPALIRGGRETGYTLAEWLELENLIRNVHDELARPVDVLVGNLWKYTGEDDLQARSGSRARDCVTKITPVMEELESPGDPGTEVFRIFRDLLRVHLQQSLANVLRAYKSHPGWKVPAWATSYGDLDSLSSGEARLELLIRIRKLGGESLRGDRMYVNRATILQDAARYIGRHNPLDRIGETMEAQRRRRELYRTLHAETMLMVDAMLKDPTAVAVDDGTQVALLWRLLCVPDEAIAEERTRVDDLALGLLIRIREIHEGLGIVNFRTESDPPPGQFLGDFRQRIEGRVKDRAKLGLLDQLIREGERR